MGRGTGPARPRPWPGAGPATACAPGWRTGTTPSAHAPGAVGPCGGRRSGATQTRKKTPQQRGGALFRMELRHVALVLDQDVVHQPVAQKVQQLQAGALALLSF